MKSDEKILRALSRREFLKVSAGAVAGSLVASLPIHAFAHAYGSDRLRVGLIGCGGRGTGAAIDAVNAGEGIEIYAMGDIFPDRLNASRQILNEQIKDHMNVSDDRCFTGVDNYKGVIQSGVDIVILATPPAFRPIHFREAVQAGKHVFMEKPVAVCPAGVRLMFEMGELASQKGLSVVAGTQRRHDPSYRETIQRIQDGAIGRIVSASCYWNQGGLWHVERQPGWTDTEWQLRNWLYFTWLSGDHIVEQHIHNIDVINWVLGAHPVSAMGMGGRQVRTEPHFGHIYDHFAVEFEYPGGIRVLSMCRQIDGCANFIGERVVGTDGTANQHSGQARVALLRSAREPLPPRACASGTGNPRGQTPQRDARRHRKHACCDYGADVRLHRQAGHLGAGAQLQVEPAGARRDLPIRRDGGRPRADARQDRAGVARLRKWLEHLAKQGQWGVVAWASLPISTQAGMPLPRIDCLLRV